MDVRGGGDHHSVLWCSLVRDWGLWCGLCPPLPPCTAEADIKDDDPEFLVQPKTEAEALLRELRGKERVQKACLDRRLARTQEAGRFMPRVELLAQHRGLTAFEKLVCARPGWGLSHCGELCALYVFCVSFRAQWHLVLDVAAEAAVCKFSAPPSAMTTVRFFPRWLTTIVPLQSSSSDILWCRCCCSWWGASSPTTCSSR